MKRVIRNITISISLIIYSSCNSDYVTAPLPKTLPSLKVKSSSYIPLNTDLCNAYTFEVAQEVAIKKGQSGRNCDMDLFYPEHNATIHISYIETTEDSIPMFKDLARSQVYEHSGKSSGINEESFISNNGYPAIMYHIGGNAATNLQFALTNDTNKFYRGVVYFWATPNYDSLKPVIDKLTQDSKHMLETLQFND